jgi:RNA polymerase sigma-70 factor (ECF subfamily)
MQPTEHRGSLTHDGKRHVSGLDDERAVDRVLQGDLSAFADIVERWQGPLVSLAYRFCHDRGRAEEMAQEAFVRAFRGLAKWRRDARFSTWLFALATNLYRSELRRIPARRVSLEEIAEPIDPRQVDEPLEDEGRRRAVRRALHSLPPRYRDVLVLFYFHAMDVATTARSLSLPEGTVKARLSRGRDILRMKLARVFGPLAPGDRDEA